MDKRDTIRAFAAFSGRTVEDSTRICNEMIDFITRCIEVHDTITISGFITMGVKLRRGGKVLPIMKDGQPIISQDKLIPYVKFSDNVKNLIKDDAIPPELLTKDGNLRIHNRKRSR